MITVSIIILSYNTKDLLESCLDSVYTHLPHELFEVIVVDNASTDGSNAMVKKQFPQALLITSDTNLGFGKGINLGAQASKGKYLLFLNSDAVLTEDVVSDMVSYLHAHPKVGVLGGLLTNPDGTTQRSFGKFYDLRNTVTMLIAGDKGEMRWVNNQLHAADLFITSRNKEGESARRGIAVDWVSGGFMLIQKEVFSKLQGFDNNFFMYMEDVELCFRVKKLGYTVHLYPRASVIHAGQGSSNRSFAVQHIYKGLLYFYKKHKSPFEYNVVKSMLFTKALLLVAFGTITHNGYLRTTYKQALHV